MVGCTGSRFFRCSSSCLLNVVDLGMPTFNFRERRRVKPGLVGVCGGVSGLWVWFGHAVGSARLSLIQAHRLFFCSIFSDSFSGSTSTDIGELGAVATDRPIDEEDDSVRQASRSLSLDRRGDWAGGSSCGYPEECFIGGEMSGNDLRESNKVTPKVEDMYGGKLYIQRRKRLGRIVYSTP